ncbi:MAG: glycosyltransferase family 4 protein [Candidatus Eisenbacteria bacterium]
MPADHVPQPARPIPRESSGSHAPRLRVLAMVPYPVGRAPGQRYRIEQWEPYLRREGVDLTFACFEDESLFATLERPGRPLQKLLAVLRRIPAQRRWLGLLGDFDAAFLFREAMILGPAWIELGLTAGLPVVYDFDDAIWLARPNPYNPIAPLLKFQGKTRTIAARCAAVLAGNEYLAEWARRVNPATHVVPSTIDTEGSYAREKSHVQTPRPTIGWSGSRSTLQYLAGLRPMLASLARVMDYRLLVVCNGDPVDWPDVPVEWRPWTSAREVDDLLEMDLGLMPQPDDEWSRGKCGMKALQYMALGIPAVVSHSGALPSIVSDGMNGRLVRDDDEWRDALRALGADTALRARLGAAARCTVRERFSAAVQAPRVAAILRSVARARAGQRAGAASASE